MSGNELLNPRPGKVILPTEWRARGASRGPDWGRVGRPGKPDGARRRNQERRAVPQVAESG